MPRRAKPAPSGRSCQEYIHECAYVMQCGGNPMAPGNATRCACYENLRGGNAYFLGVIAGRKEAMKEGGGVMERLTFDGNFCDISQCQELPCQYNTACTQRRVWEKLKAYEDSGLTPSDVRSLWGEWNAMISVLNSIGGGYEHPRQLAEADKSGRLVVLPCKVGDTVYTLLRTFDGADVVGETELWWTDIPQLGKTVFLTREEAEKELEAMKDE